ISLPVPREPLVRPRMVAVQLFPTRAARGLAGLAVLLGANVLGACSPTPAAAEPDEESTSGGLPVARSEWRMYRGDAAQTGVAAGSLGAEFEVLWSFEAGGAVTSSPVVANGLVYFGSDDYELHAVDLETGEQRWAFATEDLIEAPPMVHDETVYVGSNDFRLYAVNAATGELRWRAETDDKILGGAVAVPSADGSGTWIVVGSYDNSLYAFDSVSGERIWRYETQNFVNGTPAVLDGKVVFGGCDSALHVVSTDTGEALNMVPLGQGCNVAGSVALAGGQVFFGHYGNEFVCMDIETGETVWSYPDPRYPFFSAPAIGEDVVIFGGRDKQLHCVSRATGEPIWKFKTGRKIDGSPVICGDKVVFGSGDGWLYVLSLGEGTELWSYEIGRSIFTSPAVVDGVILIGANDSRLYAFGPVTETETGANREEDR
ncbi:MAG: PQQ-binding-like beta-propeller repeat protein, partial [Planctomycetota bacterium]